MRLEHHRRAAGGVVADHLVRRVLLHQHLLALRVGTVFIDQLIDDGLQQVELQRLQVGADPGVVVVLLHQRRQQRLQRQGDGFLVELAQLVARLAFPLRQADQLLVELLLQIGDIGMETLALGFRQLGELGLVERLAVLHRGEGDVRAIAVQRHFLFQGAPLDGVQSLVVTLVEGAVDGALLLLVGRVLEHRGEGGEQVFDQMIDIRTEFRRAARRQFDGLRFARFVEVVDVDPVGRRDQALALGLQVALDEGEAAGARLAHDEYVVARARHSHAELQGLDGALLTEHAEEWLQFVGIGEGELLGGEGTGQFIGRQAQAGGNGIGHRESLHRAARRRGELSAFSRRPNTTGKAIRPSPGSLLQIGATQAVLGRRQGMQAPVFDRLATAFAVAIVAIGQAQPSQPDQAHARLRLGQQRSQHIIVLPLLRLFGEVRRVGASEVAADRLRTLGIFGSQRIQRGTRIESGHESPPRKRNCS
ncbi:hypothetical protein D3C76_700450 [compost metagenome]